MQTWQRQRNRPRWSRLPRWILLLLLWLLLLLLLLLLRLVLVMLRLLMLKLLRMSNAQKANHEARKTSWSHFSVLV